MDVQDIISAIHGNRVMVTRHAEREAINDGLSHDDIFHSVMHGSSIEHYPHDMPYPSALILGWMGPALPVHSVWAYNAQSQWATLVTVYRPDPKRWIDWKRRVTR